jgi:hypothetical protein
LGEPPIRSLTEFERELTTLLAELKGDELIGPAGYLFARATPWPVSIHHLDQAMKRVLAAIGGPADELKAIADLIRPAE